MKKEDAFVTLLIDRLDQLKRDREVRDTLAEALVKFRAYREKLWKKRTAPSRKVPNNKIQVMTEVHQNTQIENLKQRTETHPKTVQAEHRKTISSGRRCTALHPCNNLETQKHSAYQIPQQPTSVYQKNAEVTVVGYCFSGNPVPYRTKVRGKNITLGHFKTLLNRKGYHRYFFKKYCNEFGTEFVFEEVTDEEDHVPLWEGKIFAMVEEIEELRI